MTATKTASKAARKRAERERSIAHLREMLPRGSTVYTTVKHVSRSGMARHILLMAARDGELTNIGGYAADALGWRWMDDGTLQVTGCGMDMGFHAVYCLAHVLFADDPEPTAEERVACPRYCSVDFHLGRHGYALKQRWV